jgi:hypothetical protein
LREYTKYSCLFSTWIARKDRFLERLSVTLPPYGGDVIVTSENDIEREIESKSKRYGISHYLVPFQNVHIFSDSKLMLPLVTCSLPKIGSVPANKFILYKVCTEVSKVLPEGHIHETEDGTLHVHCGPGKHEIKYRPLTGLRAFLGNRELDIQWGEDRNFYVHPMNGQGIRIIYDTKKLWLPNYLYMGGRRSRENRLFREA